MTKLYDKFLKCKTYINETKYKEYKNLFEKLKNKNSKILLRYSKNIIERALISLVAVNYCQQQSNQIIKIIKKGKLLVIGRYWKE